MANGISADALTPSFTPRHFEAVKESQRRINAIAQLIPKLEACGQNCDGIRRDAEALITLAQTIEREFFTNVERRVE